MGATALFVLILGVLVAVALAFAVFLALPGGRRSAEPSTLVALPGVSVQQPSFAISLVSAAPRGYIGWLERQIAFAGRPNGWSVTRIITWKLALVIAGVIIAFLFLATTGPEPWKILLTAAGVIILFVLPDVMINSRAHDRQEAIKRALPDTLDQMTIAVEAGLGFDAAMAKAARNGSGPLPEEFIRVLQDMSIGRSRRDSFRELEHRTSSPDLRRFSRAIIQADAYGVAIGDVLRVQAGEMRLKRRQRAEEQAMKVTVKIVFPLVLCLLPALLIVVMTPGVLSAIRSF